MGIKDKSIEEIKSIYDLEFDRIIKTIKTEKKKKVLLQFPDGLKPHADKILNEIENKTNALCFIYLDSCFGACDIPLELNSLGIDLIIQFGHSDWSYINKDIIVL